MAFSAADIPDQSGRIAIVTGANSGIGLHTARQLGAHGAKVVLACRSPDRGRAALAQLQADLPAADFVLATLDLGDLASIRAFAAGPCADLDQIDLLVNNAGVMTPPRGQTADGFELQFGTNHLGHFALTALLFDRLEASGSARVVTVSSLMERLGRIDFDNLNAERSYHRRRAYSQSKLANLMFALELARRIAAAGRTTRSMAAHPGGTRTHLQRHWSLARWTSPLWAQDAASGALPSLYAATSPQCAPGAYIGPGRMFEVWGAPAPARISDRARDEATARRLWEVSEALTQIQFAV